MASWQLGKIAALSKNRAGGGPHSWCIRAAYVKAPETTPATVKVNKERWMEMMFAFDTLHGTRIKVQLIRKAN